jgi:predicted permease
MGVRPILGRTFQAEEFTAGRQKPVIIGHGLWQRRFGGEQTAIGRTLVLDGEHHTVVGIVPRELSQALVPFQTEELWLPLVPGHDDLMRGRHIVRVCGRLKKGVEIKAAQVELTNIMQRLEKAFPVDNKGRSAFLVFLENQLVGNSRRSLHLLQAAVGFVLLIGCLNLANLLMARLSARRSEIAVRTALGAGRRRVIRQLLTETVLLSTMGAFLGLFIAFTAVSVFGTLGPEVLPRLDQMRVDWRVAIFLGLTLIGTAALFGMVPALVISGEPVHEAVKASGRSLTENRRNRLIREGLVAGQVALALVLLVSAGVLLKSFWRLSATDPGYEPRGVLQASLELPQNRYPYPKTWPIIGWPAVSNLTDRIAREVAALPGVSSASVSLHNPLTGGWTTRVTVIGRPKPAPG